MTAISQSAKRKVSNHPQFDRDLQAVSLSIIRQYVETQYRSLTEIAADDVFQVKENSGQSYLYDDSNNLLLKVTEKELIAGTEISAEMIF